ncbi:unnamed protein product [Rhizoctonia solani]|uniref:Nephrocystin 3-like N-terminal domain-containing protein n=1 Tax=Rhizoctonia solani TaxID=456999 RepID=A0A8H3BRA1_9AGAM|nr:unnamed protein product [Rhizoctonia solani]
MPLGSMFQKIKHRVASRLGGTDTSGNESKSQTYSQLRPVERRPTTTHTHPGLSPTTFNRRGREDFLGTMDSITHSPAPSNGVGAAKWHPRSMSVSIPLGTELPAPTADPPFPTALPILPPVADPPLGGSMTSLTRGLCDTPTNNEVSIAARVTSAHPAAERGKSEAANDQDVRKPELGSPTSPCVSEVSPSKWRGLAELARVLRPATEIFGPLKSMTDALMECVDIYERAGAGQLEYDAQRIRLETLFGDLRRHLGEDSPLTVTGSVDNLCNSIQEELRYIQTKQRRGQGERYLGAKDEADAILGSYRRIEGHLQRLSLNSNLSMWKITQEQAAAFHSDRISSRVDRLPSSLSARYNSAEGLALKRTVCTPGTRAVVLADMLDWARRSDRGAVYWLNGMAGTGKTTIAYSLCVELDVTRRLAGSFFCSRMREECRTVKRIIPSIAYQLAQFSLPVMSALSAVLERVPDVHTSLPHEQFDALIAEPMHAAGHTLPVGLVVVIDALDECEGKESVKCLLDVLLKKATGLPIKFILSSRPEPEIRDLMSGGRGHSLLVLHELDQSEVKADIEKYLRTELEPMQPSELQISSLVARAGILFIYAATAVRYIGYDNFRRNPKARLRTILDGSQGKGTKEHREIDRLYSTILEGALDDEELEDTERYDMLQVLYTVVCAREPLAISGLSGLLQIADVERVRAALRPMWSVVHVGANEIVTTLHSSFTDFMFDPARSKALFCNRNAHNHKLAEGCFRCIERVQPHFNICGLESSFLLDESVPNIETRVINAISLDLLYACRHWAEHLAEAEPTLELAAQLMSLLAAGLLLWLEVMNLTRIIEAAPAILKQVETWCMRNNCSPELVRLSHDAWRFTATFAMNPVSQSTPHLYISMLPFWPQSRPVAMHYAKRMRHMIKAEGTAKERRQLALLATWTFEGEVHSCAFSPGGTRIALAVGDKVLVIDAFSGLLVIGPLTGHTDEVTSVKFSPDGARIASGSNDCTLLIWDAQTGALILGPLGGHTDWITCVDFSPSGAFLASGSYDMAVRVWDLASGRLAVEPMQHDEWVLSVCFSPDGTLIASGSEDSRLYTWSAQHGQSVCPPMEKHSGPVRCVKFDPKGRRIVSGSGDETICLWDFITRLATPQRLKGHTSEVNSVAFSSDGTCIASGSSDHTIRVWDAGTGELLQGPLTGHAGPVLSVEFSPDGSRIISTSTDKTVRIWDTQEKGLNAHTQQASSADTGNYGDCDSRIPVSTTQEYATGQILLASDPPLV